MSLNTFHPSRDPSTGWWCHSAGAGGASQCYDICLAEIFSEPQFSREYIALKPNNTITFVIMAARVYVNPERFWRW